MSASRQEMQDAADRFLETLGVRMTRAGQVVLHFSDGGVFQRVEWNQIVKPGDVQRQKFAPTVVEDYLCPKCAKVLTDG